MCSSRRPIGIIRLSGGHLTSRKEHPMPAANYMRVNPFHQTPEHQAIELCRYTEDRGIPTSWESCSATERFNAIALPAFTVNLTSGGRASGVVVDERERTVRSDTVRLNTYGPLARMPGHQRPWPPATRIGRLRFGSGHKRSGHPDAWCRTGGRCAHRRGRRSNTRRHAGRRRSVARREWRPWLAGCKRRTWSWRRD
jgi:hypothetical protein